MKKILSIAVSAVSAVTLLTSFSSSAAETSSYCPKLYFKASKTDGIHPQSNKRVYINTNDIKSKSGNITFDIASYVGDSRKQLCMMIALWDSTDKYIKLTDLADPQTGDNKRAYTVSPGLISYDGDNTMSATYSSGLSGNPFTLNGKDSDSYPFAVFKATIPTDIPIGLHPIKFYTTDAPLVTESKTMKTDFAFYDNIGNKPTQKDAEALNIAVSDRALGDIDNDNRYSADDASMILREFTMLSSNKPSSFSEAQMIAADVDGDGYLSASDASYVLCYFAYLAGYSTKNIYEFYGY